MRLFIAALFPLLFTTVDARAAVTFQNAGTLAGWDKVFIQQQGTVTQVDSPSHQGGNALKMTQMFLGINGTRYHSEVIHNAAQQPNSDAYYGQAIYLPSDWQFHHANETFMQLAPDDNSGPWILVYVEDDHLFVTVVRTSIAGARDLGPITNLRGTWIRFVLRMVLSSNGTMEVWINGNKVHSEKGNFNPHSSGSIRWSNGVYATRWIKEQPVGPKMLTILHDHLRVATTYEEADPASWQDGAPGGGATPDAGSSDAEVPVDGAAPVEAPAEEPPPIDPAAPDAAAPRTDARATVAGTGDQGGESAGEDASPPPTRAPAHGCDLGRQRDHQPMLLAWIAVVTIVAFRRRRG